MNRDNVLLAAALLIIAEFVGEVVALVAAGIAIALGWW